jgi:hypothetical protein
MTQLLLFLRNWDVWTFFSNKQNAYTSILKLFFLQGINHRQFKHNLLSMLNVFKIVNVNVLNWKYIKNVYSLEIYKTAQEK